MKLYLEVVVSFQCRRVTTDSNVGRFKGTNGYAVTLVLALNKHRLTWMFQTIGRKLDVHYLLEHNRM